MTTVLKAAKIRLIRTVTCLELRVAATCDSHFGYEGRNVKSKADSAKSCRNQGPNDLGKATAKEAHAKRNYQCGKLLLCEADAKQDSDGRGPARRRNGSR